jgi:peptidoglycan-N-acetylglucosamine deacetylase
MPSGATAALAAGTAVSSLAWAVRGRSSSVFAPSVWRGKPGRKAIALTFDDGPTPSTPAILELLARYQAPATFFQIGQSVSAYPDIARSVLAAGHEVANHSHTHPLFALKAPAFIQSEFARAQEAIAETIGQAATLLRAPYGVRWFGFRSMQRRLGLTGVMWSIIGQDWKLPAEAIARRILSRAQDGDIICLHDGRGTLKDPDVESTLEAVRRIMPALLEKGYHFETVTQLLCPMK